MREPERRLSSQGGWLFVRARWSDSRTVCHLNYCHIAAIDVSIAGASNWQNNPVLGHISTPARFPPLCHLTIPKLYQTISFHVFEIAKTYTVIQDVSNEHCVKNEYWRGFLLRSVNFHSLKHVSSATPAKITLSWEMLSICAFYLI